MGAVNAGVAIYICSLLIVLLAVGFIGLAVNKNDAQNK
jgi:hypothetical protein